MEKTTTKSLQIAAILASAAIVYNVNEVKTEDDWIASQAAMLTKEAAVLNNEAAQKIVSAKKCANITKESAEKCVIKPETTTIKRKLSL